MERRALALALVTLAAGCSSSGGSFKNPLRKDTGKLTFDREEFRNGWAQIKEAYRRATPKIEKRAATCATPEERAHLRKLDADFRRIAFEIDAKLAPGAEETELNVQLIIKILETLVGLVV